MIMSFNCGYLAPFFKFSSSTLEPNLHNSIAFFKTRALQLRSPSSSAPAAGSTGHIGRQCSARGLHTPKSLLLFGTHDGHTPSFLTVHGIEWGLQWSIYSWVVLVTARVLHSPPSPTESATVSTASNMFFDFFSALCCVFP